MADWQPEQIARLLQRRPDLRSSGARDRATLAQRAQDFASVKAAIERTALPENRLLQVVVCCGPDVEMDEFAKALPDDVTLADTEPLLVSLEEAALVWRHQGRLCSSGTLGQALPTAFGPPVMDLAANQTVDFLNAVITTLRKAVADEQLPPLPGIGRTPPGKNALLDHLHDLMSVPGMVVTVLNEAPDEARALALSMARGHPAIPADHFMLSYSRFGRSSYYSSLPSYWLFERGLLLPGRGGANAYQPREVGLALLGKPVTGLPLDAPLLVAGAVDTAMVDAAAARQAVGLLDALTEVLEHWAETPARQLKSGGLGVTTMKQVATLIAVPVDDAIRIVELANLAGLLTTDVTTRVERRRPVIERTTRPSDIAMAWLAQPVAQRWQQLVAAWLRAEHWPSASGHKDSDNGGKPAGPVLVNHHHGAADAPARRNDVLAAMMTLDSADTGRAACTAPEELAAYVYWHRPQPWLQCSAGMAGTVVPSIYAEAEMLGLVASGRLSGFGRAFLEGAASEAERLLTVNAPAAAKGFTIQADLTAVVVGRLDRDSLTELRLLADVESTGAATTYRFSEASLRRGIDAGRDGDSILAFLGAHASKGVPQALEYLVADVSRRHGHLRVGAAQAFVTGNDPAVLADACAHRRCRKLHLQLLAPTVAISPEPPDKVLSILRDAGFLPVGGETGRPDGSTSKIVSLGPRRPKGVDDAAWDRTDDTPEAVRLPEPFRSRRDLDPLPITADDAIRMAEAICEGEVDGSDDGRSSISGLGLDPDELDVEFGQLHDADDLDGDLADESLSLEGFQELVQDAARTGGVVAVMFHSDSATDAPVLVGVTGLHGAAGLAGTDLSTGKATVIDYAEVGSIMELGNIRGIRDGRGARGQR